MPTFLYHTDPYRTEVLTRVKSIFEEDGQLQVALDENLFYPQGGGQKGDIGMIETDAGTVVVKDTIKDQYSSSGSALLILAEPLSGLDTGVQVTARLDWAYRYRQMRLHSAVHLHHCMIERIAGSKVQHPKTSDIADGEAYNRYEGITLDQSVVSRATEEFRSVIAVGAPVTTREDETRESFRWWDCLGYSIPCGGTHLRDVSEIGNVDVSFSQKKGKPKVTIRLL